MKKTYTSPCQHIMLLKTATLLSDSAFSNTGNQLRMTSIREENAANAASRTADDSDWE